MEATIALVRHPLSAAYEDISGPAWDEFVNDIRRWGIGDTKITLYEGMVLDGWQRYRGCLETGVEPQFEEFHERIAREKRPAGFGIEHFVNIKQNHRHHEPADLQRARRIARLQRTSQARQRGDSLRAIAAAEGVSVAQINRDLAEAEAAGVPPGTPGPSLNGHAVSEPPSANGHSAEHVTGKDGKKYPKKRKKKEGKPSTKAHAIKDDFGNILPQRCRDAFADPWLQEAFDTLCETAEKVRKAFLADGMKKRRKAYPHIDTDSFIHGVGMIDNVLEQLIKHVKDRRPAGVCQECEDGKGCPACCMSGLVPREIYQQQIQRKV